MDSGQQKEKQSKAKGCLWVIAGVGFIVSMFAALAILGAVLPEPEVQSVAQPSQPRATVVPTPVATRVYVPPTATPARVALDSQDASFAAEAILYHVAIGLALNGESTSIEEMENALINMVDGGMDGNATTVAWAASNYFVAAGNLRQYNDVVVESITGASNEFDKLSLDRLDQKLVDDVRKYHAFVLLSRTELSSALEVLAQGLDDLGKATNAFDTDSMTRAAKKIDRAIADLKKHNLAAKVANQKAAEAISSLVE